MLKSSPNCLKLSAPQWTISALVIMSPHWQPLTPERRKLLRDCHTQTQVSSYQELFSTAFLLPPQHLLLNTHNLNRFAFKSYDGALQFAKGSNLEEEPCVKVCQSKSFNEQLLFVERAWLPRFGQLGQQQAQGVPSLLLLSDIWELTKNIQQGKVTWQYYCHFHLLPNIILWSLPGGMKESASNPPLL